MKVTSKVLVTCLGILSLGGCATTYKPAGLLGGYSEMQLSSEEYQVTFTANGYTGSSTAYALFLTRAADIAIQNGYRYFYLVQVQDLTRNQTVVTPGSASTTSSGSVYGTYSQYGNRGYLNAYGTIRSTTTYVPPQVHNIRKPGFSGDILLVSGPIDKAPPPFDARMIYEQGMAINKRLTTRNTVVYVLLIGGTVVGIIGAAASSY
jgi:hypothetical protein